MVEQILDFLFRIPIPLPNNPLRELNCYVLRTPQRNLIIDTGFNHPDCWAAMEAGLKELDIDLNQTDIFLTHQHSDHTGLTLRVATPTSRIYMNPDEKCILDPFLTNSSVWLDFQNSFLEEGFPPVELQGCYDNNPARVYQSPAPFPITPATDGMEFFLGDLRLRCIRTPGHTPHHTCLYLPDHQILFSGDHILFTITPNIAIWMEMENPLLDYFESLKRIRSLPVKLCLASHRANGPQMVDRIDDLLSHHVERLYGIWDILSEENGLTGYEVAKRMKWSIRAKDWSDFPAGQKWFAVGEAITHLTYLVSVGALRLEIQQGHNHYHLAEKPDLAALILPTPASHFGKDVLP